jgi:hypothetical protein
MVSVPEEHVPARIKVLEQAKPYEYIDHIPTNACQTAKQLLTLTCCMLIWNSTSSVCIQEDGRAAAAAVSEARGRMHLLRASAWRRHGSITLAATEAATFLRSYAHDPDDTLHAYATLALISNDRQGVQVAI